MPKSSKAYLKKAYKAAKQELNGLLSEQQKIEKRLVVVRQNLQSLAAICQSEGIQVEPSSDAAYLLEKSALGDEIRSILIANYPAWSRPNQIKNELERIGHDLSKYSNPQATIQMVLKRMVESGEAQEWTWQADGKKIYRIPRNQDDLAEPYQNIRLAESGTRVTSLAELMLEKSGIYIGSRTRNAPFYGVEIDPDKLPEGVREMVGHPKKK